MVNPTTHAFPVVLLSRAAGITVARAPGDLDKCSAALFWRGKFFEGLRLVDAAGQSYEVISANVQRPETKLGQWFARLFDATITVHTEMRALGPMAVADLVRAVGAEIDEDPASFEEQTGRSATSAKLALAKCATVQEVANVVGGSIDG